MGNKQSKLTEQRGQNRTMVTKPHNDVTLSVRSQQEAGSDEHGSYTR
jgi:hypothetical protein